MTFCRLLTRVVICSMSIIVVCTSQSIYAQNFKPIQFKEFTLENGLHVILCQDKSVPIVASVLQYKVGSRDEDPSRTGFAHFFEHLMFEGTEVIPRGGVGKFIQEVGGELNAFTSFDKTVYHFQVPSNATNQALWIDAQRMRGLKIDNVGIETQRGVVKEERKQRYDNSPYGVWNEKMFTLLFKNSSYGWTPIGSSQHIDNASLQEFRGFYDTYYQPNNAVLCISGDFDEADIKKSIDFYFGSRPKGPEVKRREISIPAMTGEVRETINDTKAQLPGVFVGFRGVAENDPDSYALSMLTDILANGESSRMYRRLVEKDQSAVQASVFSQQLERTGAIILIGIAAPGKQVDIVEKTMYEEIENVITNGVTDAEFRKAVNIAEANFIGSKKGVLEKALALADAKAMTGNAQSVNTDFANYTKVTRDDIKRVAAKYFKTNNRVVLTFVPTSNKK